MNIEAVDGATYLGGSIIFSPDVGRATNSEIAASLSSTCDKESVDLGEGDIAALHDVVMDEMNPIDGTLDHGFMMIGGSASIVAGSSSMAVRDEGGGQRGVVGGVGGVECRPTVERMIGPEGLSSGGSGTTVRNGRGDVNVFEDSTDTPGARVEDLEGNDELPIERVHEENNAGEEVHFASPRRSTRLKRKISLLENKSRTKKKLLCPNDTNHDGFLKSCFYHDVMDVELEALVLEFCRGLFLHGSHDPAIPNQSSICLSVNAAYGNKPRMNIKPSGTCLHQNYGMVVPSSTTAADSDTVRLYTIGTGSGISTNGIPPR